MSEGQYRYYTLLTLQGFQLLAAQPRASRREIIPRTVVAVKGGDRFDNDTNTGGCRQIRGLRAKVDDPLFLKS